MNWNLARAAYSFEEIYVCRADTYDYAAWIVMTIVSESCLAGALARLQFIEEVRAKFAFLACIAMKFLVKL